MMWQNREMRRLTMATQKSNQHNGQGVKIGPFAETIPGRMAIKAQRWIESITFQRALGRAYGSFAVSHPQWVESYFDEHFVRQHAAPLLLRRRQEAGMPAPEELATLWANQFGPDSPAGNHIVEATTVAADFLDRLQEEL